MLPCPTPQTDPPPKTPTPTPPPTVAEVARQVVDSPLDLFEQVWDVFVIKGQAATQQGVQDDSTAPHINLRPGIQLAADDLCAAGVELRGGGVRMIVCVVVCMCVGL